MVVTERVLACPTPNPIHQQKGSTMGFFADKSYEAVDNAIANVKDLGAQASQTDRDLAAAAAKQAGERGNKARAALGKDK